MSEFRVEVVRIRPVAPHPNADRLGIVHVADYPVIVALGELQEGDLAVYVPVDALVPSDDARWTFLGHSQTAKVREAGKPPTYRIKAVRLRGVFSMGLLVPAPPGSLAGDNVEALLRIDKYEPPEPLASDGCAEKDPGFLPVYDVEALRRWPGVLQAGEAVVVTEKIHGANGRFAWHRDRLWVASHNVFKRSAEPPEPETIWRRVAVQYGLAGVLQAIPGIALYGEVYGAVQALRYGVTRVDGLRLAIFDALDIKTRRWLDWAEVERYASYAGIPTVPILHRGPWDEDLRSLAEGRSMLADHVREGIVVRPERERYDERCGRVLFKLHGEGYLTRREP